MQPCTKPQWEVVCRAWIKHGYAVISLLRKQKMDGWDKYHTDHVKRGLCRLCQRVAVGGRIHCEYHLQVMREHSRNNDARRREGYVLNRRCTKCSSPLDEDIDKGFRTCINCRENNYETIKFGSFGRYI